MIRIYPAEIFKEFKLDDRMKKRYAISNFGRLVSFNDKVENGTVLTGSKNDGYKWFVYYRFNNKIKIQAGISFHKLVAENFISKKSEDQIHILHLDFNRQNNHIDNLKWATREEKIAHNKKSPLVIQAKINLTEHNKKRDGPKLTATEVIRLEKMLINPNRKTRLKLIARQFGISEMQLYRIKSGENWGHIKVDGKLEK